MSDFILRFNGRRQEYFLKVTVHQSGAGGGGQNRQGSKTVMSRISTEPRSIINKEKRAKVNDRESDWEV